MKRAAICVRLLLFVMTAAIPIHAVAESPTDYKKRIAPFLLDNAKLQVVVDSLVQTLKPEDRRIFQARYGTILLYESTNRYCDAPYNLAGTFHTQGRMNIYVCTRSLIEATQNVATLLILLGTLETDDDIQKHMPKWQSALAESAVNVFEKARLNHFIETCDSAATAYGLKRGNPSLCWNQSSRAVFADYMAPIFRNRLAKISAAPDAMSNVELYDQLTGNIEAPVATTVLEFVLLHEISHIVKNDIFSARLSGTDIELQADVFAYESLLKKLETGDDFITAVSPTVLLNVMSETAELWSARNTDNQATKNRINAAAKKIPCALYNTIVHATDLTPATRSKLEALTEFNLLKKRCRA